MIKVRPLRAREVPKNVALGTAKDLRLVVTHIDVPDLIAIVCPQLEVSNKGSRGTCVLIWPKEWLTGVATQHLHRVFIDGMPLIEGVACAEALLTGNNRGDWPDDK